MMCIEGTTWGPFPPQSQQILWLKLAHALTDREVAMSVTYHLLSDESGARHHGRTSTARTRVALCEIMSQGAVSWLGLGGPGTGNLLRSAPRCSAGGLPCQTTSSPNWPRGAGQRRLASCSPRSFWPVARRASSSAPSAKR